MPGTCTWHFLICVTSLAYGMKQSITSYIFPLLLMCLMLVDPKQSSAQSSKLFTAVPGETSELLFQNRIVESPGINIITYEYFYNGGGVGAGDFNNDGLVDLYFTGNMSPNKLYLNKGGLRFEDVTRAAGVAGKPGWKTGVSVADVNGDGWLDIYVCYSGDLDSSQRANQLFINNGDLTFTDKAKEMGVADKGYTTHAAFFDMDRDGDLDLFVMNHNIKNLRNFDAAYVKKMVDPDAGDRLYENINGKFADVSKKAGIIANPLGYGLGLNISDLNNDGWPDIYVSNDYIEEDYLYLNNKNGSFTETLKSSFGHLSNFSMGVDVADINNDGHMDVFTLDMLPEDNRRQKLLYAPDNYELYANGLQNGFYHQLMRNMLQLNNGNGSFSEIGQLAGVSNTDWSWAALLADFNLDGNKDLFVTNGYGRDMINRDFMKFYADQRLKHIQGKTDSRMFQMLQGIQSTPLHNYIYENMGDLQFKDQSVDWGFEELNFSHGAVYADLDNDGDLDLAINRMNQEVGLYKNNTIENKSVGHFLKIDLRSFSNDKNRYALGSVVTLYASGKNYTLQQFPVHGFQSSMQVPLHFGLKDNHVDSLRIVWPDGLVQFVRAPIVLDTTLVMVKPSTVLSSTKSVSAFNIASKPQMKVNPVFAAGSAMLNFTHSEDQANDFKIQPLMTNMYSFSGPRFAKADVNGDRLEDIYICGPRNHPGRLFLQQRDGNYREDVQKIFATDMVYEDCGAIFFDADNDGDLDLYVVSGGFQVDDSTQLDDRLYLNDRGKFSRPKGLLPAKAVAGSVIVPMDFDRDGDLDLFAPGRVVPGEYPVNPLSRLLVNDGKGKFEDLTARIAPVFNTLGMVTDARWIDLDGDKKEELVVVGEWSTLRVFRFVNMECIEVTQQFFKTPYHGWWNTMKFSDLDRDGDLDLVVGNWGMNSQLRPAPGNPVTLYYGDFDGNGFIDPLFFYPILGKSYPMASRDEITDQMVSLRQRFPTYDSYADAQLEQILDSTQINTAKKLYADFLHTVWFENTPAGMIMHRLPVQADFAPVYAIWTDDFDHDGNTDIFLGGNVEHARIKIGKVDANYGILLKGNGKGDFKYVDQLQAGLNIKGCIRDIIEVSGVGSKKTIMIGINGAEPVFISY